MLDYRAWIAAAVLLFAAAGGYLVYLHRTRAAYQARSLSASGPTADLSSGVPPRSRTRTLHVNGCDKDFLVPVGELVEPQAIPGASLSEFRSIYGPETQSSKAGIPTWDENAFTLTEGPSGGVQPVDQVHISVYQGHVVETLDGIELGIDSFGTLFRKLRDLKVDAQEHVSSSPDGWTLTVSFSSACGRRFRSEYSRTLPANPEIDKLILPQTAKPDGSKSPFRSDVFMNKIITGYTMAPFSGRSDAASGSSAEQHN